MRRRKVLRKRVEFVLNPDNEREAVILAFLDTLTRHYEASEWIKSTLYAALCDPDPPATAAQLDALRHELLDALDHLTVLPVTPPPAHQEPPTDAYRQAKATQKIKGLSFAVLAGDNGRD